MLSIWERLRCGAFRLPAHMGGICIIYSSVPHQNGSGYMQHHSVPAGLLHYAIVGSIDLCVCGIA